MLNQNKHKLQLSKVSLFVNLLSKGMLCFVVYLFVFQSFLSFINPLDEEFDSLMELVEEEDNEENRSVDEELLDELVLDASFNYESLVSIFFDKGDSYYMCHSKCQFENEIPYPPPRLNFTTRKNS